MMLTVVLLGPQVELASMMLEDLWELELSPSQDQLLEVPTLEQ